MNNKPILSDYQKLIILHDKAFTDVTRLSKENQELKETLKQTQNSWFEDNQKIMKLKKKIKNMLNGVSVSGENDLFNIGYCKALQDLLESEEK